MCLNKGIVTYFMEQEIFEQIGERIMQAKSVLVLAHHRPDGDTLGSALALKIWLDKIGKKAKVFCKDLPAEVFAFMPQIGDFVRKVKENDFDLVLAVDLAGTEMAGYGHRGCPFFSCGAFVVNIDHHASNDRFGDLNFVDPNAASTTVIIYRLLKALNVSIDREMATALLTGIYTDTGCFMHSNTNDEAYEVAGDLLRLGGKASRIMEIFRSRSVDSLRLWGKVLNNLELSDSGVLSALVRRSDYVESEGNLLSGVVDYLNMVPGVKFSLLLNEDRRGNVKVSMRTRDRNVDLAELAKSFGGGGHPKAAGFLVEGQSLENVRDRILSQDLSKKS